VCCSRRSQKSINTPYFRSLGSFKVIDVDTTEKLETSACCDRQHAHAYQQLFSRKTGQQWQNNDFYRGTAFLQLCASFFISRKSRLGLLKSTFNAKIFISSFSTSISIDFGAIRFWNVSHNPKSQKNPQKPLFWHSRSSKVIEFGGNWEPAYDFPLVINSNLSPISHCYWNTATYWPKIANFSHIPLI